MVRRLQESRQDCNTQVTTQEGLDRRGLPEETHHQELAGAAGCMLADGFLATLVAGHALNLVIYPLPSGAVPVLEQVPAPGGSVTSWCRLADRDIECVSTRLTRVPGMIREKPGAPECTLLCRVLQVVRVRDNSRTASRQAVTPTFEEYSHPERAQGPCRCPRAWLLSWCHLLCQGWTRRS